MSNEIKDLLIDITESMLVKLHDDVESMERVTKKQVLSLIASVMKDYELSNSQESEIEEYQEKLDQLHDLDSEVCAFENMKSELAEVKKLAIEINNYGTIDQCKRFVEQFANTELVDERDAACSSGCGNILDGNTNFEF